jgi:hypothetical protein
VRKKLNRGAKIRGKKSHVLDIDIMFETAIFCYLPKKNKSLVMLDYQGFA